MQAHMVVARFDDGVSMDEVLTVVAEEQARVAELQRDGALGAIYLATAARRTVFLEVRADNAEAATAVVRTLPMARWWSLDVYPLNGPAGSQS